MLSSSVVVMFILFCVNPSCVVIPQYVPQNLYPVYKNKVVPVADIITPNQFEAEWVQSFCFVEFVFGVMGDMLPWNISIQFKQFIGT